MKNKRKQKIDKHNEVESEMLKAKDVKQNVKKENQKLKSDEKQVKAKSKQTYITKSKTKCGGKLSKKKIKT